MYQYDIREYESPKRLYDPESGELVDLWQYTKNMTLTFPDGRKVVSHIGDVTDKASIPRAAWWWLPRDDRHIVIAARFHDCLYERQEIEGKPVTRLEVDKMFRSLMIQSGMRWTQANLAYIAVRAGGWVYWNKRREALDNG